MAAPLVFLIAISLAQARELADRRNGTVQAAKAALAASRAGIGAAGQLPNPTLSASYGPDEPRFTSGLDVRLPVLGQRGAAIASAEASAAISAEEVKVAQARVHAAVRRAYFALWAASAQEQVADAAAAIAGELARLTAERYRLGTAPQLDVEQATLAMRRAGQDREDRAAEKRAAASELEAIVGASIDAADAPGPAQVPSLEDLLPRAPSHPEVQSLHAQEAAALARADEERTAVRPLPTVSLTAEHFATGDPVDWGLRAGIAFDLPLLSWNRGRVQEQEGNARAAAAQAQATLQRLSGQIRSARARWAAASARATFYRDQFVPSADRVLEMARAGYRIGRTSLISVLQAQSDLSAARSRAIDADLEAERSLADLEEATGADL